VKQRDERKKMMKPFTFIVIQKYVPPLLKKEKKYIPPVSIINKRFVK